MKKQLLVLTAFGLLAVAPLSLHAEESEAEMDQATTADQTTAIDQATGPIETRRVAIRRRGVATGEAQEAPEQADMVSDNDDCALNN